MFTWIPFYEQLGQRLREYENRQGELVAFLEDLRTKGIVVTPLMDKDATGARFVLTEIDPFTFFGSFNRRITESQRIAILEAARSAFSITAPLPSDFNGIPILDNRRSWFFQYQSHRLPSDVPRLWAVFERSFVKDPIHDPSFQAAFNEALQVKGTSVNLTIGLFWIRPSTFLSVDAVMRDHLGIQLPSTGLSFAKYNIWLDAATLRGKPFHELSLEAWSVEARRPGAPAAAIAAPVQNELPDDNSYWLVGAYWSEMDPSDQTERFLEEEIWENGYEDRHLDTVKSMKVGDRIAIKAATVQKHGLPFEAGGKSVSKMTIKAVGVITQNFGDGRRVKVEWQPMVPPREWYFYTYQGTVWHLRRDEPNAKALIDFVFNGAEQDYKHFLALNTTGSLEPQDPAAAGDDAPAPAPKQSVPYSIDDFLAEGVFLTKEQVDTAIIKLGSKKNLVLQGPPGVGKTFIARKLAFAFMGARDDTRVEVVQFHQSYSYEDFVRGYRPAAVAAGGPPGFSLTDGPFVRFCERALKDERPHVFIIDEMNRGNLAQIFGELLMLLEADKRGREHSVTLAYSRTPGERFYVPGNVYVIGMMNLADRSLAMVDYALRRRFAFVSLEPQVGNSLFKSWLLDHGMKPDLVDLVVTRIGQLNQTIGDDANLGPSYRVGHSFFIPNSMSFGELGRPWFDSIIETEIGPLIEEYWHADQDKAKSALKQLTA